MRDLRTAPAETLLRIDEIVAPDGPGPFRRTKFLDEVAAGRAPQPALRAPRCVRWKWGDIQAWLAEITADRGGARQ